MYKQGYIIMMFTLKFIGVILMGSLCIISCSTSRQTGVHSSLSDQSNLSSNDSSWIVAPLQSEDLQLLDIPYISFWSGEEQVDVTPYILKTENNLSKVTKVNGSGIRKTKGYRIQLFAGREQDRALDIKAATESRFGISVYLVYEAPQYKVRAGNFINRMQATELLNNIKMDGFRDAWIVRSHVEIEK